MISSRRSFLVGPLASLFAAPAVVRAASLMPVRALPVLGTFVEAAHQSGHAIVVRPLVGVLNLGDVITIDGVEAISRARGVHFPEPLGALCQFVVTMRAEPGHRVVHIYPPIIPVLPREHYATVVASPRAGAKISVLTA